MSLKGRETKKNNSRITGFKLLLGVSQARYFYSQLVKLIPNFELRTG